MKHLLTYHAEPPRAQKSPEASQARPGPPGAPWAWGPLGPPGPGAPWARGGAVFRISWASTQRAIYSWSKSCFGGQAEHADSWALGCEASVFRSLSVCGLGFGSRWLLYCLWAEMHSTAPKQSAGSRLGGFCLRLRDEAWKTQKQASKPWSKNI